MPEKKKETSKRKKRQSTAMSSLKTDTQLKTESKDIGVYDENGRLIGLKA